MKKLIFFTSILSLLLISILIDFADARKFDKRKDDSARYKKCHVKDGRFLKCADWYTGKAVVLKDMRYNECEIDRGRLLPCRNWYTGRAPVLKGDRYRVCDINNGRITSCENKWYTGEVVAIEE